MEKRRNHKKWYIILFLLAVLSVLSAYTPGYFEYRLQSLHANIEVPESVERYEALIKAAQSGQDLGTAEYSRDPFTSDELQAAQESMATFAELEADFYERIAKLATWKDIYGNFPDNNKDWTGEQWEILRGFIEENADYIEAIRELAAMGGPYFNLPQEIEEVPSPNPFNSIAQFSRLLSYDSAMKARSGDWDGVLRNLTAQNQIASTVSQVPEALALLVAMTVNSQALDSIRDCAVPGTFNSETNTQIIQDFSSTLDRTQLANDLAFAAQGDAMLSDFVREIGWERIKSDFDLDITGIKRWFFATPPGKVCLTLDDTSYTNQLIKLSDLALSPYYEVIDDLHAMETDLNDYPFYKPFTPHLTLPTLKILSVVARNETQVGLLNVGLSLEAYYAEHGSYPESLDGFTPLVEPMPVDPFTGEAFHYTPNGDTFILYSVGTDLEDDCGQHDKLEGDLVWRGRNASNRIGISQ